MHGWEQNILIEPTIRLTSDSPGDNYHYFLTLDANGWSHRIYKRNFSAGNFSDTGNLIRQGFTPYGDLAQQWSANAFLFELYRTKSFRFRF